MAGGVEAGRVDEMGGPQAEPRGASMAGSGMGWRVAAGRGGAGGGVEVATGAGVEVGLARNWLRSGRRSGASTTVAELTSRVPAAAGWGGAAEPTVLARAPMARKRISRRENEDDM